MGAGSTLGAGGCATLKSAPFYIILLTHPTYSDDVRLGGFGDFYIEGSEVL